MSLAEHEFKIGCERLSEAGDVLDRHQAKIGLGQGHVVIRYEPLEGVRLGGLLALPRAKVTLNFTPEVLPAERTAFARRFDISFQRGGG